MTTYSIIVAILSLITMIVFFVMAARIGKISKTLTYFQNISMADQSTWRSMKCDICHKEFKISKGASNIACPNCQSSAINDID